MSSSSSSGFNAEQAYQAQRQLVLATGLLVAEIRDGVNVLTEEQQVQKDVIEELQVSLAEGFQSISELVANQTAQIDTLKSRQAISGAFQAISLVILVLWLMTLAIRALYECITKKVQADQEEKHQEMIEMLEASLARRKAKRRATAKQTCETPQ